jgi:hypothetical protein
MSSYTSLTLRDVVGIEIDEIIESDTLTWREIRIRTKDGEFEIHLHAANNEINHLRMAL